MVAGLSWVALCAMSVGFSAAAEPDSSVRPSLRDEVRAAMRDTLPSQGAIDDAEARRLLTLFEQLTVDDTLGEKERGRLLDSLRRRLVTAAEQAHARAERAKESDNEVATVALPPDAPPILAQQQPVAAAPAAPAPAAPPGAPPDSGDDLARLIVATIAPESWEQNGGNGSIYYYRQWQCLVVRQTDGVHQRLGRLAAALRQP